MSTTGFFVGRAGLFKLFASFKAVGEPAPTSPTRMVQDVNVNLLVNQFIFQASNQPGE